MNKVKVITDFQSMIKEISKTSKTHLDIFKKLRRFNLSRVELMIIDSALKGMPLENLHKTLILPEKGYDTILQNLTFKLVELYQSESPLYNTYHQF